jgi:hypothetical protein
MVSGGCGACRRRGSQEPAHGTVFHQKVGMHHGRPEDTKHDARFAGVVLLQQCRQVMHGDGVLPLHARQRRKDLQSAHVGSEPGSRARRRRSGEPPSRALPTIIFDDDEKGVKCMLARDSIRGV